MNPSTYLRASRRLVLGSLLALFAATAFAQGNSAGNITGKGTPGATVTAENAQTGVRREVTVPASGKLRIAALPVGTYSVVIREADGSTSAPKYVAVRIGTSTRMK